MENIIFPVTKAAIDKIQIKGYKIELLLFIGEIEKLRDNNVEIISEFFDKPIIFGENYIKITYHLIEDSIKKNVILTLSLSYQMNLS